MLGEQRYLYAMIHLMEEAVDNYNIKPTPEYTEQLIDYKRQVRYINQPVDFYTVSHRVINTDYYFVDLIKTPFAGHAPLRMVKGWFNENEYLKFIPCEYDCSAQCFTLDTKYVCRRGVWWVYHTVARDI